MSLRLDDLAGPRWECVHFTEESPEEMRGAEGVEVRRIDASGIEIWQPLIALLVDALDFPSHFGWNRDALDDTLRDLPWLESGSLVLLVEGSGGLWRNGPEAAGSLISAWLGAAERWAERGVGFHLVFVMTD